MGTTSSIEVMNELGLTGYFTSIQEMISINKKEEIISILKTAGKGNIASDVLEAIGEAIEKKYAGVAGLCIKNLVLAAQKSMDHEKGKITAAEFLTTFESMLFKYKN